MASGLDGHVGGLHKPRPSASSCQTSAEHFQQCGEFLPVRNRGLRPLAVTVLPVPLTRRATYRLRRRAIDSAPFSSLVRPATSCARNVSGYPRSSSNSYHAANAERTEAIARSRGGAGRAPRSEMSKAVP